jgi:hypothetical protein
MRDPDQVARDLHDDRLKSPRAESKGASKLAVNKLTWAQVGRVTEPGRYMFKFGWLTITADDLAVWKQYPGAAFALYSAAAKTPSGDEIEEEAGEEFRLGSFEIRSEPSSESEQ